ncbi:MAG: HD domain-containing protein, partial [Lachnospiraceae bacterium]|nr:HD domain-containing protein [Lachnospiraceae bacterium]
MMMDYSRLNNSLDKMEKIMGITNKKMNFDAVIIECDPDYAVIKARKIVEAICRYLVITNRLIKDSNSIRNATIDVYLRQYLRTRDDLFPKSIVINIETIQKYGNYGGHFQTGDSISEQDLTTCLSALTALLDWFNNEYDLAPVINPEMLFTPNIYSEIGNRSENKEKKDDLNKVSVAVSHNDDVTREEIVMIIKKLSFKFAYNIYERINTESQYNQFYNLANKMFKNSVEIYSHGKLIKDVDDKIEYIIKQLTSGQRIIQVKGLPGTGKNMILQLAFYKMLKEFEENNSHFIPLYVSVNYYEQMIYEMEDVNHQIRNILNNDLADYIEYVKVNKDVKPILFIDAIREHQISDVIVENILNEIIKPIGRASRIISIDSGLVKNKARLKKVITVASGDDGSCSFIVKPIPINNKVVVMEFIDCVLKMYDYEKSPGEIYEAAKSLKYSELDIFLVRLLTKEMFHSLYFDNVSISEMYEKMALAELSGDEQQLLNVSEKIFNYIFINSYKFGDKEKSGAMWMLAHKHQSFMEFLIAFYFISRIKEYESSEDYYFFQVMLTFRSNQFVDTFIQNDYSLQEIMVSFINDKYEVFNIHQKSNAAYWMGKITYKNLSNIALKFLTSEFSKLKMQVKANNKNVQENLDNHFLFRAICMGLLAHGQANMLDEYLCIVITNDIANALNRGTTMEYYGDAFQMAAHNTYYLDTDLCIGERALIELSERIEASLYMEKGKFVEHNLLTMLSIIQARIQNKSKKLKFDIIPYINKALKYLEVYKTKPQNVASSKIIIYFDSIKEDLESYLRVDQFDVAPLVYNKYRGLKDVKRKQWVKHDIYDPESVSEHSFSAWLMAALFLPEEYNVDGYIKKEILDMIMIHDMAEAELGDGVLPLNEPTSVLESHNYVMKKLFLKGTYPDIANLTYYYNVWTGYYNGININAKVARDVNLI